MPLNISNVHTTFYDMRCIYDTHINIVRVEYDIKLVNLLGHNLICSINSTSTRTR